MKENTRILRKKKRRTRVRGKVFGTADRPRLSVHKSLRHIYAQIIDDEKMITLAAASTLTKGIASGAKGKTKVGSAELVGVEIARLALDKGIERAAFDRNGSPYHGRVKALAEAARKAGLKF